MDIRRKLVIELAKDENMPFLLDLHDLLPEVFTEFRMRLFETKLSHPPNWVEYVVLRAKECVHIAHKASSGDGFFRFSVYLGNADKNMYYGITGPWGKATSNNQVEDLGKQVLDKGFNVWSDWRFRYFLSNRQSLFDCISHNQDIEVAFAPFREEFFAVCDPLKDLLEKANRALLGQMAG